MDTTTRQAQLQRPLLTIPQAALLAGISTNTAYRWLAAGELPGTVRAGGRWYVRRRVLESWLRGETELPVGAA